MLAWLTAPIADPGDRFTRDMLLFSGVLVIAGLGYGVTELRPTHLDVEVRIEQQRGAEGWVLAQLEGGHAGYEHRDGAWCRLVSGRCSVSFGWSRRNGPYGGQPSTLSLALNNGRSTTPLGEAVVRAPSGAPVQVTCRYGGGCVGVQ